MCKHLQVTLSINYVLISFLKARNLINNLHLKIGPHCRQNLYFDSKPCDDQIGFAAAVIVTGSVVRKRFITHYTNSYQGWWESLPWPPTLPLSTKLPNVLLGDKISLAADEGECEEQFLQTRLPTPRSRNNWPGSPRDWLLFVAFWFQSSCVQPLLPAAAQPRPGITPEAAKCSTISRSSVRGSGECHAVEQGFRELYYLQIEKQSLMRAHSPPFLIREAGGAHSPLQREGRGTVFTVTMQRLHLGGLTVSFHSKSKK